MFRVGLGYDIHRLVPNRQLTLGGVVIPFPHGLEGHSDADVLLHAVCDSLLGAAGLPDIGQLFPNTDDRFKNADSRELLKQVTALVGKEFSIVNIDTMLLCERPRIAPYIPEMKSQIKKATGCSAVNIKATTSEGMNDEGAEKCISAQAVCLLKEKG